MPKILTRLVSQLKAKGFKDGPARAIAIKGLQKSGNLKKGSTEPTDKGIIRGKMTPGERAKDRAAKYSDGKHSAKEYNYNKKTNRSRLK